MEWSVYSRLEAASLPSLSPRLPGVNACSGRPCVKRALPPDISVTRSRLFDFWSYEASFSSSHLAHLRSIGGFYWISLKNTTCLLGLHVTVDQRGLAVRARPGLAYAGFRQTCLWGALRFFLYLRYKTRKSWKKTTDVWLAKAAERNHDKVEKYRWRLCFTLNTNNRPSMWHVYGFSHRIWIFQTVKRWNWANVSTRKAIFQSWGPFWWP